MIIPRVFLKLDVHAIRVVRCLRDGITISKAQGMLFSIAPIEKELGYISS
jgi:hypothetical protein